VPSDETSEDCSVCVIRPDAAGTSSLTTAVLWWELIGCFLGEVLFSCFAIQFVLALQTSEGYKWSSDVVAIAVLIWGVSYALSASQFYPKIDVQLGGPVGAGAFGASLMTIGLMLFPALALRVQGLDTWMQLLPATIICITFGVGTGIYNSSTPTAISGLASKSNCIYWLAGWQVFADLGSVSSILLGAMVEPPHGQQRKQYLPDYFQSFYLCGILGCFMVLFHVGIQITLSSKGTVKALAKRARESYLRESISLPRPM